MTEREKEKKTREEKKKTFDCRSSVFARVCGPLFAHPRLNGIDAFAAGRAAQAYQVIG